MLRVKVLAFLFTPLILVTNIFSQEEPDLSYLDVNLSFEDRADLLLNQMTLNEKVSQLMNDSKAIPRLKVPQYNWWNECLHGVARNGYATVFPQSISVAASFDKELMHEIGTVISDEARAKYHDFVKKEKRGIYTGLDFWSPNINIFRDPRWGRGHETYGEDPYLTGELATQFITGLQGEHPKYFKTIATSKHFAVHSGPEALRHEFDVDVSERDLYETYLPAFYKTVTDGKVYSVMGAYNRFRGASCSGHDFLLNELLRDTWGFNGYVVSDCGAIRDIYANHRIVETEAAAAAIGVKGGCDLNCGNYYKYLNEAVEEGLVTEAEIDIALRRLLMARFKMGMFDPDSLVPYSTIPTEIVCCPANNSLARKAAQESIVLLKNDQDVLPLSREKVNTIAVIGPNADNWESLVGNYHGTPKNPVTFLKGIENKVNPEMEVLYAEGAHLSDEKLNLKPIPSVYLQTVDGVQGLTGNYFNNTKCEGEPLLVRVDDMINFWWEHQPISKDLIDNFSVRWEGFIVPPSSGNYQLGIFSKRGMGLKIEGKEISNGNGSVHHGKYATETIYLEAGKKYSIEICYYSDESNAQAQLLWAMPERNLLEEAVQIAQKADVSVLVLGLSQRIEGEGGDRKNITLPAIQDSLLRAIQATGKPVILVLNAGSALAINWAKEHVPAILSVGYPGEEGGNALADVLFGDYNPAGRLPMTYYTSLDELPPFEDYDMKDRTYRYYKGKPLFPFGYGLSYTQFDYEDLKISSKIIAGDTVHVSVKVTNTGDRDGDEVVQIYLNDNNASTPRPVCQLEAFKRITLKAGESKEVHFKLNPRQFSIINDRDERVIEPGTFTIYVGGAQPAVNHVTVPVTTEVISGMIEVKGKMSFEIR